MNLNLLEVKEIVRRALMEDIGPGDITTSLTVPADSTCRAQIISREEGVFAGLDVAVAVLAETANAYPTAKHIRPLKPAVSRSLRVDPKVLKNAQPFTAAEGVLVTEWPITKSQVASISIVGGIHVMSCVKDGGQVAAGDVIAHIAGPTRIILTAERTMLNLLQRMSGIATTTAALAERISQTGARVVDTRKTAPGLRMLDKYAVRVGGGDNHRFGLYDAVLIKDNHIKAAGGIGKAVKAARKGAPHTVKVEVEADTLDQVREALEAGAEMILLDNMDIRTLKKAVKLCKDRAVTEASGNVTGETIVKIAQTGVDLISVGALTHSVKALDLSLEIVG